MSRRRVHDDHRDHQRRARRLLLGAGLLLAAGVVAVGLPARQALADDFVLIRNAKNPVASVPRARLKDMTVGRKKTWVSGPSVQVVLGAPGSPELDWFARTVMGMSETAMLSRIKQEVFKGELRKPVVAATDKDCLAAVAADAGAFGVVHAAAAKSLPPDVAVLSMQ